MSSPTATHPPHAEASTSAHESRSGRYVPTLAPEPPHGMFHDLLKWFEAMAGYFHLRAQLALLEAKEAGSRYALVAGLFAAAAFLALLGYLLLVLTAVFAIAAVMDGPNVWLKVLSGATVLHLIFALLLALVAKARLKAGIFEKTQEEFQKDKPWPQTPISPNAPKN